MVPNQVVATVNSVKGQAFARGPDGLRPLKPGDSIHEGETLVTGDGPVVLTSDVGNPFSIPGRTEVAIAPDDEEVEMTPKQLEEIIAKLQPNLDEMDPPATGGGGPNEGHDTAEMVARVDEPIRPLRGSYRFLNDENPQDPPRPLTDPTDPPPTPPRSWQGADDNFTVKEGSTTTFDGTNNVLLNDGDGVRVGQVVSSDGSGINVLQGGTSFPTALGGTVTIYPDGHFVYTAPLRDHSDNVPDEDSFQYRAVNSNGGTSDPITVKIQIADTDPNATNDYIGDTSYTSRNTGNVITEDYGEGPDTSPAGDVIHVVAVRMGEGSTEVSVTQSSNFGNDAPTLITENGGRVWINPDGSFQYAAPQTGYDGLDSFQYKLTDTDSESDWATVTVDVKELPPDSVSDKDLSVDEGSTTSFASVLANDGGKAAAVASVTGKDGSVELTNGTATITTALGGTVTINADGTFEYTAPLRDHSDNVSDNDYFYYQPVSAKGTLGTSTKVSIAVKDTVPVAVDDDLGETDYVSRNTGNVIEGEIITHAGADKPSADGPDALHVVAVRTGEGGTEVGVTQSSNFGNDAPTLITEHGGRVWINPDGSFQYAAPQTGYDGLDSFQYKLTDTDSESDWATVTVDVKELPPDSVSDKDLSVDEGSTTSFASVLANDGGKAAAVASVTGKDGSVELTNGTATITTALGGTVTINADGTFEYTAPLPTHTAGAPEPVDSFQYVPVNAEGSPGNPATVSITVKDTVPVAVDDDLGETDYVARNTGNVIEGEIITHAGADKPSADGLDALHVVAVRAGEGGTEVGVTQSSNFGNDAPTLITENGGRVWINPDGSFQYAAPQTGYDGVDSFQYKLTDTDSESDWATVTVDVKELPPASFSDNVSAAEGATTGFESVLANDGGKAAAVANVTGKDGSAVDLVGGAATITTALGGTVTINADGTFEYTAPLRDHSDNVSDNDHFYYQPVSAKGTLGSSTKVNITVTDTVPVANDDYIGDTDYVSRNTGNVKNDYGSGADKPSADGPDALHIVAVRTGEGANAVEVTQSSNLGNDAPTLVTENGGRVWINPDGTFQYAAPQTGYDGEDSFQYQLTDTDGRSEWATVTFNVLELPPANRSDNFSIAEGTSGTFNVLANDGAKDTTTVGKVVDAKNGEVDVVSGGVAIATALGAVVTIRPDGNFDYTAPLRDHSDGESDYDHFSYRPISDQGTLGSLTTVNIAITDTAPTANDGDSGQTNYIARNTGNVITGAGLDTDASGGRAASPEVVEVSATHVAAVRAGDGDLNVIEVAQSNGGTATFTTEHNGTVWINSDGSFQYRAPQDGYSGPDSFQYQLVDDDGSTSDWATITVDVKELPPASQLTGEDAEDVFAWTLSDVSDSPLNVSIAQFTAGEDKLDLRDLLADEGKEFQFDTEHLSVSVNDGSTRITVSPVDSDALALNIVVEGVDLTGGNAGQEAIDYMLKNGTLVDDK